MLQRKAIRKISQKQKKEIALRRKLKAELILESGNKCMVCGKPPDWIGLELVHKKALSQGGKTDKENLILACHKCHMENYHHQRIV